MTTYEVNFDGLVGPTHNYAGLSYGNVASDNNQAQPSNPKQAALQGLAKMKAMHELGLLQGIIPPQERPDLQSLRRLGFSGSDEHVLGQAKKRVPTILAACCSASSMWTANAATISPSADTADGKVHITPANLASKFHRSIEHTTTGRILKKIFHDERYFLHHPALPVVSQFGDEGAANHTRFCRDYGSQGVEFFVYGGHGFNNNKKQSSPQRFPARQTLEASEAIARLHRLDCSQTVYAQQNPSVIDQGVFHNDVIAVGNRNILFCHEKAFLNQQAVYDQLRKSCNDMMLSIIEVSEDQVSVAEAVSSYLFNSQLLTVGKDDILIVPSECKSNQPVSNYLKALVEGENPITAIKSFDLRQSMKNGGGPACLRLRVVMTDQELASINQNCIFDDKLFTQLTHWVEKHYRDHLSENDLADPSLIQESRAALDELTQILDLGSIYHFQQ